MIREHESKTSAPCHLLVTSAAAHDRAYRGLRYLNGNRSQQHNARARHDKRHNRAQPYKKGDVKHYIILNNQATSIRTRLLPSILNRHPPACPPHKYEMSRSLFSECLIRNIPRQRTPRVNPRRTRMTDRTQLPVSPGEPQWPARSAEVNILSRRRGHSTDRLLTGRKLKCDGQPTCANCHRRGLVCEYVPV